MTAHSTIVVFTCTATAILQLPASTFAQDRAYIQGRLDGLQKQLVDLSSRIEQLKAEDRQLQEQLEGMQVKFDARLERLEKGRAPNKGKPR
jgi:TolA-binding protein